MTYTKWDNQLYTDLQYLLNQKKIEIRIKLSRLKSSFYRLIGKKEVSLPIEIWIEPTNICNLKCIMCPQSKGLITRKRGFMDFKLYKKIIDEVCKWKPNINLHHMGEAFLYPRIFDMIKYAKFKKCGKIKLTTNATLLNKKNALQVLNSGLEFIHFSFDGATKKSYEKIRVNANFDKTLENIINFLKLKSEKNKRKPHVLIEILNIKTSKKKVGLFIKKFKKLNVNTIHIKKLINWAGYVNLKKHEKTNKKYIPCLNPWYFPTITWEGDVLPCCTDFNAKYKLGNIKNEKLIDIWNNQKIKFLRNCISSKKAYKIALCKNCSKLYK